jgi:hypothetical protein
MALAFWESGNLREYVDKYNALTFLMVARPTENSGRHCVSASPPHFSWPVLRAGLA